MMNFCRLKSSITHGLSSGWFEQLTEPSWLGYIYRFSSEDQNVMVMSSERRRERERDHDHFLFRSFRPQRKNESIKLLRECSVLSPSEILAIIRSKAIIISLTALFSSKWPEGLWMYSKRKIDRSKESHAGAVSSISPRESLLEF